MSKELENALHCFESVTDQILEYDNHSSRVYGETLIQGINYLKNHKEKLEQALKPKTADEIKEMLSDWYKKLYEEWVCTVEIKEIDNWTNQSKFIVLTLDIDNKKEKHFISSLKKYRDGYTEIIWGNKEYINLPPHIIYEISKFYMERGNEE